MDHHRALSTFLRQCPRDWWFLVSEAPLYRDTSLIRNSPPLGPYSRPVREVTLKVQGLLEIKDTYRPRTLR